MEIHCEEGIEKLFVGVERRENRPLFPHSSSVVGMRCVDSFVY